MIQPQHLHILDVLRDQVTKLEKKVGPASPMERQLENAILVLLNVLIDAAQLAGVKAPGVGWTGCRCSRVMGNDFWFLPTGNCLFGECENPQAEGRDR